MQENVQEQNLSKDTPESVSLSEVTEECEAEKLRKGIEEASNDGKEQAGAELEFLETEEKMTDSPQGTWIMLFFNEFYLSFQGLKYWLVKCYKCLKKLTVEKKENNMKVSIRMCLLSQY